MEPEDVSSRAAFIRVEAQRLMRQVELDMPTADGFERDSLAARAAILVEVLDHVKVAEDAQVRADLRSAALRGALALLGQLQSEP
jgi:hypothetical protein